MEKITVHSTLAQISDMPEFAEVSDYMIPLERDKRAQLKNLPLYLFDRIGQNSEMIVEGFSRLQEVCLSGKKIWYPLHAGEETEANTFRTRSFIHFPVERRSGFVVVCAGGGYASVASMTEGFPSCKEINDLGYHAFFLNYGTDKAAHAPNPIDDLAETVQYIMDHADELNVDGSHYAVCGFSAGGHLAACFGTRTLGWVKYGLPRPEALLLAYPLITMQTYTHAGSRQLFLQESADDAAVQKKYSVEEQIDSTYPPTYVWQCSEDAMVPIQNTQMLTTALQNHAVPFIYETYAGNCHGWATGKGTAAEGWLKKAISFWESTRTDHGHEQ